MGQDDPLHIMSRHAQAGNVRKDLFLSARQTCIDDGQPVGVNEDISISDNARDNKYIINDLHFSKFLLFNLIQTSNLVICFFLRE